MLRPYWIMKNSVIVLGMVLFGSWCTDAFAFRITQPLDGTSFEAGTTLTVELDPEEEQFLTSVMVMVQGESDLLGSAIDVYPPFEWAFTIPPSYSGALKIVAIGDVLGQTTGDAPQAEANVYIVMPSGVALQSI